ncbi:Protein tyrosine phosphatase SHP1/Cofactor for p97 ATPase-mediated vesicle membrane fusion [Handroanthus impetiginosus]|uniref:Protein tyrosine phosphatase SHP1/Cofactor for p97 ATPase-mediated vesicle membrane fusion n=1 Tax=Handroanthus impetiginosus TaxID=429701 RepID=A0A2G9HMP2_9LAMI|nr:Protein tyrosine phosphatase SHP1/Cofactor for p97 ATPase-mediated vesicle membrane fusion [Handroanthus impetiginosus]
MENQSPEEASFDGHPQIALINTFCEITACASKSEALFFLESHNFDLDAAVSTFLDDANPTEAAAANLNSPAAQSQSHYSPSESLSPSPSRSRSPSPPPASRSYSLRSSSKPNTGASASGGRTRGGGGGGGIRTLADLNRIPKDEDSDSDPDYDPQEYYTGGEKSGMLVRDPSKANSVDAIFNQARQAGAVEASAEHLLPSSSSRRFAGTGRLLSGGVSSTPQPPEAVTHNITFWRNGFTVDDGPLRRMDDPANASFLESIRRSECPRELAPADQRTAVQVNLTRKEEDYKEPPKRRVPFQGVPRTLSSTSDVNPTEPNTITTALTTAPTPSQGLVVEETQPSTSIQLRLADGTRMISRFNNYHTIRDVRGFIDASRPDGPRTYQLQSMGFPPKQLTNLDQTIEEAGIANSVVIQKL